MSLTSKAIAFAGARRIALGPLAEVAVAAKRALEAGSGEPILVFDAVSGQPIDVDVRRTEDEIRAAYAAAEPPPSERGRGRPKLGVTAREVTLLPRHWDWLATQRGGASAALRRLVDEARRETEGADRVRLSREALYRFITALAGDAEGYEETVRALFAGDEGRFTGLIAPWPTDIRDHALTMARPAFGHAPSPLDGLIPEAKRGAVEQALAAAFPGGAVEAATRMTWGASGAGVFKLAVGGAPCILRIEGPPDGFRDPVRHYACLKIAAEAGVAPLLLYADAQAGVSLVGFIDSRSANPTLFGATELKAAVEAVRRLHAAPLFPRHIPYFDALDGLMGQFSRSGLGADGVLDPAMALYRRLTAAYPTRDPHLVSSHNDLNPSNILFEGERVWIVDWETSAAGDPYADIAALANWFAADAAAEALVLETYFGAAPDASQAARFRLMRQINRLFFGAILIGSAAVERPDLRITAADLTCERFSDIRDEMRTLGAAEGRHRFGCAFIAEALHLAEEPQMQAALREVCD